MADAGAVLSVAAGFHRAGALDDADRLYARILDAVPGHGETHYLRGLIAHQRGDAAAARARLCRALAVRPASGSAHALLARVALDAGAAADALAAAATAAGLPDTAAAGAAVAGLAAARLGRPDAALPVVTTALRSAPQRPAVHLDLAALRLDGGDAAGARGTATRAVALAPDDAGAWSVLMRALRRLGARDDAARAARTASHLAPQDAVTRYNHALLLDDPGSSAASVESAFRRALALQPGLADAHAGLARTLARDVSPGGRDARCAVTRAAERAVRLAPERSDLLATAVGALCDAEALEPARRLLGRAVARRPGTAAAWSGLGDVERRQGRFAAAAHAFRRALALAPDDGTALTNLGTTLLHLSADGTVMGCYRRALALLPSHGTVHENIAVGEMRAGSWAEARASLIRALALAGTPVVRARLLGRLARARMGDGDPTAAIDLLDRVARMGGDSGSRAGRRFLAVRRLTPSRFAAEGGHRLWRVDAPETVALDLTAGFGPIRYDTPGTYQAELRDVAVVGRLFVVLDGGRLLYDGLSDSSPASLEMAPEVRFSLPDGRMLLDLPDSEETLDTPAVLLGGSDNFSHTFLDWSSRLGLLARRPELAGMPVVVSSAMPDSGLALMRRLGLSPSARLVRLAPGRLLRCRELHVPSLTHRYSRMAPRHVAHVRSRLGVDARPPGRERRRLFLTRATARHRRLINEAAILDRLGPFGLEVVRPETLSVDAQIDLFGDAELIVGPVGGGSAAIVMAPADAAIVELTHSQMRIDQYAIIAGLIGQPYAQVVGAPVANATGMNFDWDFEVEPAAVEAAIARLLR